MKKYFSVVLFRTTNLASKQMVYEETFLQVIAENQEEAMQKANAYGKSCETVYKNDKGETLQMEFIKIGITGEFLNQDSSKDVSEIFARNFQNFDEYIDFVI